MRFFRPNKNIKRMNKSSARIALPTFGGDRMIDLIGRIHQAEGVFYS
jgi:branched-chain amino acid aminotransferase